MLLPPDRDSQRFAAVVLDDIWTRVVCVAKSFSRTKGSATLRVVVEQRLTPGAEGPADCSDHHPPEWSRRQSGSRVPVMLGIFPARQWLADLVSLKMPTGPERVKASHKGCAEQVEADCC